MEKEKVRLLLSKYFDGDTSLEEEKELKRYFKEETVDEEFKEYQHLFSFLRTSRKEKAEVEQSTLFQKIPVSESKVISIGRPWFLNIAAGLTLLILGFGVGKWTGKGGSNKDNGELAALQQDVKELKKMLTLTNMQQSTASERIKTVSQSTTINEANQDIIEALLLTLNSDPNVNVRLAACEALYQWHEEPLVRKGLVAALSNQSDPGVQIKMIHMLVLMKEKTAITEMQKLTNSKTTIDVVKSSAALGIARLL